MKPLWTKKCGNFVLKEYEPQPMHMNCCVIWTTDEGEGLTFHFGGWGMEREEITQQQCYLICQSFLMQNADTGYRGFAYYLASAEDIVFNS